MSLLTVKNLSQTFIDKTLYEDANFVLNKEDHMGVTGQNGVGKSTLIKILTGEITQDAVSYTHLNEVQLGFIVTLQLVILVILVPFILVILTGKSVRALKGCLLYTSLDENGKPIPGKLTWTASDGTTFIEVVSPMISGYTPDKTVVNAVEGINQDSKNIETKVVYTANVAKAEIIYVDETTGKELEVATVDGKYNETINYSTADKIKYYESLGYELVKDGYTGGEFGEATKTSYVTFKHGTVVVNPDNPGKPDEPINPDNPDGPKYPTDSANLNKDVTHTIYYVYADGTVAKPSHTQTLTFTGSGVIDKVTCLLYTSRCV